MEFNQSRITVTDTALTPILDWIITEGRPGCKVFKEFHLSLRDFSGLLAYSQSLA
jgi:hypothetical protein